MAPVLTEEEKKKIEEEEETRARIRLKYERKSSGVAGVLSSVCPGLGQIYNGQIGKATLYVCIILVSLVLLSAGILFHVKGMPTREHPVAVEQAKPVEMNDEGVVLDEQKEPEAQKETSEEGEKKPATPTVLVIIGAIGIAAGWNYSIKDAVRSAKKINASY